MGLCIVVGGMDSPIHLNNNKYLYSNNNRQHTQIFLFWWLGYSKVFNVHNNNNRSEKRQRIRLDKLEGAKCFRMVFSNVYLGLPDACNGATII